MSELTIGFPGKSVAEGGVLAEDLRQAILDTDPHVQAQRKRIEPSSQDFGAALAVVLGSASVVAVAKGIRKWLELHQSAELEIKSGANKTLVARGMTGDQLLKALTLLSDEKRCPEL